MKIPISTTGLTAEINNSYQINIIQRQGLWWVVAQKTIKDYQSLTYISKHPDIKYARIVKKDLEFKLRNENGSQHTE